MPLLLLISEIGKESVRLSGEYDLLQKLINTFQSMFTLGISSLEDPARLLFFALITIEIALVFLLNWGNGDQINLLVRKILKYGVVIWVINNYHMLINSILSGFIWVGIRAGSVPFESFLDIPLSYAEIGINIFVNWMLRAIVSAVDVVSLCTEIVTLLAIVACIFIISLELIVTYLEFSLMATLSLIFVPFGANKYTSFLIRNAGNTLFAYGSKLMVLAFVAGLSVDLFKAYASATFSPFGINLYPILIGTLVVLFLSKNAHKVAEHFVRGAPIWSADQAVKVAIDVTKKVVGLAIQAALAVATAGASAAATGAAAAGKGAAAANGAASAGKSSALATKQAAGALPKGGTGQMKFNQLQLTDGKPTGGNGKQPDIIRSNSGVEVINPGEHANELLANAKEAEVLEIKDVDTSKTTNKTKMSKSTIKARTGEINNITEETNDINEETTQERNQDDRSQRRRKGNNNSANNNNFKTELDFNNSIDTNIDEDYYEESNESYDGDSSRTDKESNAPKVITRNITEINEKEIIEETDSETPEEVIVEIDRRFIERIQQRAKRLANTKVRSFTDESPSVGANLDTGSKFGSDDEYDGED